MGGSELYWVPRVAWEHLVATEDHNWPEALRCYIISGSGRSLRWVLRLRLGKEGRSGF